jgi:multisubunit Na+/H+ antiporter MnhB subunit
VIVGGVFYMLSQGDPGKVARAKNTILYALIGLIVSLLSFAIVNFVLEKVAGK